MKWILLVPLFALAGCASSPKCGIDKASSVVFTDNRSCVVRIRSVLIGSKMNLPKSVSSSDLVNWQLAWRESEFKDGQVVAGHFVLMPLGPARER